MTIEEIKALLTAYRDDLSLEDAPGMAEALQHLETDSELAVWFAEDQAQDERMRVALGSVPVPRGLKERLLNQVASVQTGEGEKRDKLVAFPRRRWMWLSAAALFVIAASLVKYFAFPPPVRFPGSNFTSINTFRDHMAHFANSRFVLDHMTKDLEDARTWLAEHESPAYEQTPGSIVDFQGMGCKTFNWGKHTVSLVCFKNDDGEIVHLFVMNKQGLTDLEPVSPLNEVLVLRKLETGGWTDDQHVYLLVGSDPEVEIGELLKADFT